MCRRATGRGKQVVAVSRAVDELSTAQHDGTIDELFSGRG
jgi:hypothetical protein